MTLSRSGFMLANLAATGLQDDARLPRTAIEDHGVDGDEEFAGDGGQRSLLGFASPDKPFVDGGRVPADAWDF
jgi:hypothetical protein